jgi:hypothetical protein
VSAARRLVALALFGAIVLPAAAAAGTARELLDKMRVLNDTTRHWKDRTQTMNLLIVDARGGERKRELKLFTRRDPGDEDKSLSIFLAPPEVKGTGFLQWNHKKGDAEQWLFLPELNRTRRITSQLRDDSFVGTDFTYRDLEVLTKIDRWTEEEAPSKLLREEPAGGLPCQVIELRPKLEGDPYARVLVWLDAEFIPRRLDFHKEEDTAARSLMFEKVENVGKVPTPMVLDMKNLAKGSHTKVDISDVKYDAGLGDDVFTQRQLERGLP